MAGSGDASLIVDLPRALARYETRSGDGPLRRETADRGERRTAEVAAPVDRQATLAAVERVQDFVRVVQRDLQFSVDEESGRTIVKVLDSESGELIRQIPPERILQIAENLDEANGILFRGSA